MDSVSLGPVSLACVNLHFGKCQQSQSLPSYEQFLFAVSRWITRLLTYMLTGASFCLTISVWIYEHFYARVRKKKSTSEPNQQSILL